MRWRHKASGSAFGLSCVACFEQPAGVFAGCGSSTHLFVKIISREIHLERAGWRLPELLNPLSLRDFPLSGGYGLRYRFGRHLRCFDFFRNLADTPVRRLMPPGASTHLLINTISRENHLAQADPLQVPVGYSRVPGGDKLPSPGTPTPFYTTVGHIPVPGEFHEGCLFPLSKDNSGLSQDFIIRIMVLARKWNIVQSLD